MATLKIKFRKSSSINGEGTIYFQVIHKRIARQHTTSYHLYPGEWDPVNCQIMLSLSKKKRICYLQTIQENLAEDIRKFYQIIEIMDMKGKNYTADDVITEFRHNKSGNTYLFGYMESIILNLRVLGKTRTSETYTTTLNSFKRFREGKDIELCNINSSIIMSYEAYMKKNNILPNSCSFYMRNLRAVYNRAVDSNLTIQQYPFKHVYTGVDKTIKRAIQLNAIKKIKELDLSSRPKLEFARNMFLFSFYTRGMSIVDMAFLKKNDLKNGILQYRRRKTGQQLNIRWEKSMEEIVALYNSNPIYESEYLLPIIDVRKPIDIRDQYIYAAHNINRALKSIGKILRFTTPLTMYVARHTWASIARSKNIPLSIISEGMGHDSERTTQIYLSTLDTNAIDRANRKILELL